MYQNIQETIISFQILIDDFQKHEKLILSVQKYSEVLNISERTVRAMIKDGRIDKKDIIRINQGTGNHPIDEQKRTGKLYIDVKDHILKQLSLYFKKGFENQKEVAFDRDILEKIKNRDSTQTEAEKMRELNVSYEICPP